jgi:hypothetical protein
MRWYRLAAPPPQKDPFPFVPKAPTTPQGPKITWPEKGRSQPPLDPEEVKIPPPPPNKNTIVNEILKMISAEDIKAESLVALRDMLRGEGFWKGLMSKPKEGKGEPGQTEKEPPHYTRAPETAKSPETTEPLEPPARTPAVQKLREQFKAQPPPPATFPKGPTDYETRLRGQSSQ